MRFGLVSTAASAEASVGNAASAEALGFDAAVWGDHWMGLFPPSVADHPDDVASADRWYHALTLLAVAAERTTRIRLAIGVTDLLRRHPVDIAQALLTLTELHESREFVLGVGLGEAENVTPFGLPYHQKVNRLREGLQILKALLADGRVDNYQGEFFQLHDAVLEPRGTTTRARVWVAAHGPRMLALCGEIADGWYPLATSPRRYGAALAAVRASAAAAGRAPEHVEAGLAVNICVVDDDAEAAMAAEDSVLRGFTLWSSPALFTATGLSGHPIAAVADGFRDYIPSKVTAAEYRAAVEVVPAEAVRRAVVIGSVARITEVLEQYCEAGAETIFLWDVNRMRGLAGREGEVLARMGTARGLADAHTTPG